MLASACDKNRCVRRDTYYRDSVGKVCVAHSSTTPPSSSSRTTSNFLGLNNNNDDDEICIHIHNTLHSKTSSRAVHTMYIILYIYGSVLPLSVLYLRTFSAHRYENKQFVFQFYVQTSPRTRRASGCYVDVFPGRNVRDLRFHVTISRFVQIYSTFLPNIGDSYV